MLRASRADTHAVKIAVLQNEPDGNRSSKLEKSSPISKLSPFLDDYGVVRMAGRTETSQLAPCDAKLPIKIGRSQVKRRVALFTCLVVRAVHWEVKASLSSEAYRLYLRKTWCADQISTDHGTNFSGSSREFANQIAEMNHESSETFRNANTRWFFIHNPPRT